MKKMEKYIDRNWIWLATGMILTRKAIEFAYVERGYVAFGGEWLILPVMMLLVCMARNIRRSLFAADDVWEEVDAIDRRTSRYHRRMAK